MNNPVAALTSISIHALLAESDDTLTDDVSTGGISIHALLAESDLRVLEVTRNVHTDFYPRSPCGERPVTMVSTPSSTAISIHALLAESDVFHFVRAHNVIGFLSTLSLRRATVYQGHRREGVQISIHALLAESDKKPNATQKTP